MSNFVILGIIQGLTEFLPVSSSGHLVLADKLLGLHTDMVVLSVVLHLGTILALLLFFLKDLLAIARDKKFLFLIAVVTVITGIIGVPGKKFFESLFVSPKAVGISLIITGIVLLATKRFQDAKRKTVELKDGVILGVAQGLAIAPGISRSGITISALLFRKIDRGVCFRFSFLACIPAVLGAAILEAKDIDLALKANFKDLAVGFIVSFATGMCALWLMKLVMRKAKLHYFGYYCIIVAILTLLFIK
jgi:undecaprenyl-diphosphatase